MAQKDIMVIKKPGDNVKAVAVGMGVAGAALILYSMTRRPAGAGSLNPLAPGEKLEGLASASMDMSGTIEMSSATGAGFIIVTRPTVRYLGPGRNAYTTVQIKQYQLGQWVTVYGSGIAGSLLAPATILTPYDLVPASQPQPAGCPSQALCAQRWQGDWMNPICGAPPVPGVADVHLEIYERRYQVDADGYSSPSCNATRKPVARRVYSNKIMFR